MKEITLDMRSRGWSHLKIIKELGISYDLLTEIMDYDPMSVNIRKETVVKFTAFLEKHEKNQAEINAQKAKIRYCKEAEKNEFAIEVPVSMQEAIPECMINKTR